MRKGILAAATLAAGLAVSAPAMAQNNTSTQTIPLVTQANGDRTATFTQQPGAGTFRDTFLFATPQSGRVTIRIESLETAGPPTNVNFNATGVRFNGTLVPYLSRGVYELRQLLNTSVNINPSTLVVNGTAGALGTYTGTLTYSIPEPSMWALMILGFGFTGAALRSRRRSVAFSAA